VTPTRSLVAKMVSVFRSCGCATLTTTAEMTATSRHSCVGNVIVQPVGSVAPVMRTIVAYLNGYSATVRMTAETVLMSDRTAAPNATPLASSNARTVDAYLSSGYVILPTTVVTAVMNPKIPALANTESAPRASSSVPTANALHPDGGAITRMIVAIGAMRLTARNSSARSNIINYYSIISQAIIRFN
jgi:hypothetical protein